MTIINRDNNLTFFHRDEDNVTVGTDKLLDELFFSSPGDIKHPTEGLWFQSSFTSQDTLTEVDKLHIEEAMKMAKVKYAKAFEKLAEE